jgi:hypothetical protein
MKKIKYKKRDNLDVILTDSRPVELVKCFTLSYFYKYLQKNKKLIRVLEGEKRDTIPSIMNYKNSKRELETIAQPSWHAAPLKFKIYKNNNEFRNMALINPLSMIEMYLFESVFEKEILLHSETGGFSIRKHKENEKIVYDGIEDKGVVRYKTADELNDELEASGSFFEIYPYKYLSDFYKSDLWFELNRKYKYFGKADYSRCFDSIYTHTFTWIITKDNVDSKSFSRNSNYFLNQCDTFLQNINGSVTNGVSVGAEFSRLLVEIILQEIDERVKLSLLSKYDLNFGTDYEICRFVDDLYLFANENSVVDLIITLYRKEAEYFHLGLNEKKLEIGTLPHVWNSWKDKIVPVNEYIMNTLFSRDETSTHLVKNLIRYNKMIPTMKMLYQNIIAENISDQNKITGYVLSSIYNRLDERREDSIFAVDQFIGSIERFINLVFYVYSFSPSFNNTNKLVSILYKLTEEVPDEILKDILERQTERYTDLFETGNIPDISNLLLLISLYGIRLPQTTNDILKKQICDADNPLLVATYLMYEVHSSGK